MPAAGWERKSPYRQDELVAHPHGGRVPIATVPVQGRWYEVDSQTELRAHEAKLNAGGWSHDWR